MQAMVLSIIGKDAPGLADDVAKAVKKADGDWLKSSFCQLSGHFAGFVEINLPKANHNTLIADCHAISNLQITLVPAAEHSNIETKVLKVIVTGNDRQGIVSDVTGVLKSFNLNISELTTTCESAPNWGNLLFTASIAAQAPIHFDSSKLTEAIENIADDLMVDIKDTQ